MLLIRDPLELLDLLDHLVQMVILDQRVNQDQMVGGADLVSLEWMEMRENLEIKDHQ